VKRYAKHCRFVRPPPDLRTHKLRMGMARVSA
jgi:hypothetical protein